MSYCVFVCVSCDDCVFINQPRTVTVTMWVWMGSRSCWARSTFLCDLMRMGTFMCCICVSLFLFVSVYTFTYTRSDKDPPSQLACCQSHPVNPAACWLSLQYSIHAGLTSLFHHLLLYEVTVGPAATWLSARWQVHVSMQAAQLTTKETNDEQLCSLYCQEIITVHSTAATSTSASPAWRMHLPPLL